MKQGVSSFLLVIISSCDGENSRNLLYCNVYLLMHCNGLQKVSHLWKDSLAQRAKAAEGFHLQPAGTNPAQSAVTESYRQLPAA